MEEHDEVRALDPDDVQEIIDWAVSASAVVVLMHHAPEHSNDEEAKERLDGYIQAIQIMIDNMPDALVEPAHVVAATAVEDAEKEQELVEQFIEEMKDL